MPFPEAERVVYTHNPLERVVCQLRFPAILKIESELPADFQESIRHQFPLFTEKSEARINIPQDVESPIPANLVQEVAGLAGTQKNYEFSSEDGHWTVNLSRAFLALTTNEYVRWHAFKEQFEGPVDALSDAYAPDFISRVGLGYVDVIKRSTYGLSDVGWDELLQPYIAGLLGSANVSNNINSIQNRAEIRLSDENSIVRVVTRFVEESEDKELCFVIDSDFFNTERSSVPDALNKLDFFNVRAFRLFRWCISERLHNALEPSTL